MILFSLLLVSGTVVAVILYYRDQEARIILARDSELTSVAELKVRQIVRWRIEREEGWNDDCAQCCLCPAS